ncbi:MAG: hypothetical protein LGB54_05630 [Sulfurovum sp.]|nr:hypothetical protein [Sulfurovum sp.]
MQLNEILEKNNVEAISKETRISQKSLEILFNQEFSMLDKVKTMGFISIIEREYHADLSLLKKEAKEYYASHVKEENVIRDISTLEKKKERSKLLMVVVILLLAVVSWYFFVWFDQEKLQRAVFFSEQQISKYITSNPNIENKPAKVIEKETINSIIEPQSTIIEPAKAIEKETINSIIESQSTIIESSE